MPKFLLEKYLFVYFLIFLFTFSLSAQSAGSNFKRQRNYDVQHYTIQTKFDRTNKILYGDTKVQLKPLTEDFKTFELDANGLKFVSISLEPQKNPVQYKQNGGKLLITLDKPYSKDDLIAIRFVYSTKPKKGVYFVDEIKKGNKIIRHSQVWTQGESEESHHWFPSNDFPSDKVTTEQFITVNNGETAIANGEFLGKTANPNGTITFHYKMPVAHSTYLTSFVIGRYVKISDQYKSIPLGFYVYPGKEALAQKAFGDTKKMMEVFEEVTGLSFPFNKYDQTIVANFRFGGMENITATTMSDTDIMLAEVGFGRNIVIDLVSHELAHSWFGNLVTCDNWAELWLNEGFATFMEAVYREKTYGRENYLSKIRDDAEQFIVDDITNKNRHGLFNILADPNNDDSMFDTTTYQKGGAVIHTLRETVGEEAFWKAFNLYLNRYKFANVETADLQKVMEETSAMKLDWFFKQWVYGAGFPKLQINPMYDSNSQVLHLKISQTQTIDGITPPAFILPMEIEIETEKSVTSQKIEINNREQTIEIKVDGKPNKLLFDKNNKIPLKVISVSKIS